MEQRILDIADHLLLIEQELKVQGWWSADTPSDEMLASTVPFAVDSMSFEQWLQWIFLPHEADPGTWAGVAERLGHPGDGRDGVCRSPGTKPRVTAAGGIRSIDRAFRLISSLFPLRAADCGPFLWKSLLFCCCSPFSGAGDSSYGKIGNNFLDLLAPNHKNPDSAVEGLPEADPLSRS
jgi:hypothetical protein